MYQRSCSCCFVFQTSSLRWQTLEREYGKSSHKDHQTFTIQVALWCPIDIVILKCWMYSRLETAPRFTKRETGLRTNLEVALPSLAVSCWNRFFGVVPATLWTVPQGAHSFGIFFVWLCGSFLVSFPFFCKLLVSLGYYHFVDTWSIVVNLFFTLFIYLA